MQTLILCYWPLTSFDPQDILQGFPSLKKLTIRKGNLTKLTSPFPNESRLIEVWLLNSLRAIFVFQLIQEIPFFQKIEITETTLKELPKNTFINLLNLKIIDLRNDSFPEIDVETLNIPSLRHIYLSGKTIKHLWSFSSDLIIFALNNTNISVKVIL